MTAPLHLSLPYRLAGPGAYQGAEQAIIRISKFAVGADKFEEMVKSAVDDVEGFFKKYGLKDELFSPPVYMLHFTDNM